MYSILGKQAPSCTYICVGPCTLHPFCITKVMLLFEIQYYQDQLQWSGRYIRIHVQAYKVGSKHALKHTDTVIVSHTIITPHHSASYYITSNASHRITPTCFETCQLIRALIECDWTMCRIPLHYNLCSAKSIDVNSKTNCNQSGRCTQACRVGKCIL